QDLVESVASRNGWRDLRRQLAVSRFVGSLSERGRISRLLRRQLSERYFVRAQVPATIAIPGSRVALRAPLSKVCLIVSSRSRQLELSEASPDDLARKAALCGYYERTPFRRSLAAMAYADQMALTDLISVEEELLTGAFGGAKCLEVVIPQNPTAAELVDLRHLLEEA
ncbi:MAG: hypothetical protein V3W22_01585, partial [Thermoplasmata archaeon]